MNASTTPPAAPICDYEGSTYRTDFWEGQGRAYEDGAERAALTHLLPPRGQRLLDVGAGFGRLAGLYGGYERVILLDYSRSQLEYARQRLGDERFIYVAADMYRLPLATSAVDTTVMVRALHHMADVPAVFAQLQRVTRPQGTLVLEFANKRHLKSIARWLLRRQAWSPFDRTPVEFAALNFDFHPRAVEGWLRAAHFEIGRRLTVSHFRLALLKRLLPLRLLVAMDSLAQWSGGLWQLTPSVFVGARAVGPDDPAPAGALWRCPACASLNLRQHLDGVDCLGCRRTWPLSDGIYDFRDPPA